MLWDPDSLANKLNIAAGDCVAIIGAGGKTTLMLELARRFGCANRRTLVTTTTRIWPPAEIPLVLGGTEADRLARVTGHFDRGETTCCVGRSTSPDGKLLGLASGEVCRLALTAPVWAVLVEADGAAGRLVKAHGPGEPVVPYCANRVLVVAGLAALGRPIGPETVHRLAQFCAITGARVGESISADHLAACLSRAATFAPPNANVTCVLTQPAREVMSVEDDLNLQRTKRVLAVLRIKAQTPFDVLVTPPGLGSQRVSPARA